MSGDEPGARGADNAAEYAGTLGLALQLTDILGDALSGRTCLPADDLATFGCLAGFERPTPPRGCDLAELVHFEVLRARVRAPFTGGHRLLPMPERRRGARAAAMAGIHRRLLDHVERDPDAVLRGRVSLPGHEKAYVTARSLSGLDTRQATRDSAGRSVGRYA